MLFTTFSAPAAPPLQKLDHPAAITAGVSLYCLRDDRYTPAPQTALQGNKVRKLSPYLECALQEPRRPLLVSFGGAYSNHLSALATAGRIYGLKTVIYVRGEEVGNELLRQAAEDGAELIRISRAEYRQKSDADWLADRQTELAVRYGLPASLVWFIPEGGTSPDAVRAVALLYKDITNALGTTPDYLCLAAGTGGTAAGLIMEADPDTRIEIFPALKGNWMADEVQSLLPQGTSTNWACIPDYHFGGYGKFPVEWIVPSEGLAKRAFIGPGLPPLEPVYTAKLFSGVLDRMAKGRYRRGSSVVVVHTGGVY